MKFRKIIILILFIFMFSACSSFMSPKEESSIDNNGTATEGSEGMIPSFTNDEMDQSKNISETPNEKLIQNIGLEIETKEYTTTVSEIESLVRKLNGYILNSYVPRPKMDKEFSNLEANLTVMIPTVSIDEFILKTGQASNIVSERREAYNVTDSYRDTESRITTLKAKELRLLDLLKESGTLADLLTIENELSNTRYEIDRLQATILDYDKRIQYTQFNLIIREVYEYSPSDEASLWEKIVEGFTNNGQVFLRTLENGFVFILTTLPFMIIQVILWCLPLLLVYFIYRKVSKKKLIPWFKQKIIKVDKQDDHKE